MLTNCTSVPASFACTLFITLVIRGQDSGQWVKMNEATES